PRDGERQACAAAASQVDTRYGWHARTTDTAAVVDEEPRRRRDSFWREGAAEPVGDGCRRPQPRFPDPTGILLTLTAVSLCARKRGVSSARRRSRSARYLCLAIG